MPPDKNLLTFAIMITVVITYSLGHQHQQHHQQHQQHRKQQHHHSQQRHEAQKLRQRRVLEEAASSMPSWVAGPRDLDTAVEGIFHGVVQVDADDEGAPDERPVNLTPNIVASASEGERVGERERESERVRE